VTAGKRQQRWCGAWINQTAVTAKKRLRRCGGWLRQEALTAGNLPCYGRGGTAAVLCGRTAKQWQRAPAYTRTQTHKQSAVVTLYSVRIANSPPPLYAVWVGCRVAHCIYWVRLNSTASNPSIYAVGVFFIRVIFC